MRVTPPEHPAIDDGIMVGDPRWDLVQRVAASQAFVNAPVLRKFLLYVCEQALHGHAEYITEQQIGFHVFGRPADYNLAEQNIVRVRARAVRQRLENYFKTEGIAEAIIISMPKGHYVPVFESRPVDSPAARADAPVQNPLVVSRRSWREWSAWWVAGTLAVLCFWLWIRASNPGVPTTEAWDRSSPAYRLLWTSLYDPRQTLILVADSNVALFQDMFRKSLSLQDYVSRAYVPRGQDRQSRLGALIATRQYTGLADVNVVVRILQINPSFAQRTQVRFARYAEIRDLKTRNVILLGSPRGNPWVAMFESRLNFLARYDPRTDSNFFENALPKSGEPSRFALGAEGEDYASVAYLRNLGNTGWVLILSGLNMQGVEAAGEEVAHPELCLKLLKSAVFRA